MGIKLKVNLCIPKTSSAMLEFNLNNEYENKKDIIETSRVRLTIIIKIIEDALVASM